MCVFILLQFFHELKLVDKGLQTLLSRLRHDVTPEQFSGKDKRSLPRDVQQLIKEVRVSYNKIFKIFTTHKQSLGQGNVFTPSCRFVGHWLPSMHHRSHDHGDLYPGWSTSGRGGLHLHPGGLRPRGIWKTSLGLPLGGSASRGVGQIPHPPRYMGYYGIWSTGGQYASYWNAFLFIFKNSRNFLISNLC